MDKIDAKIIELLAEKGDITATEISEKIHFSVPAVNKRIRALKNEGVIKSFTVITDNKAVGKPIMAFIFILLKSIEEAASFFEYVNADSDVLECYGITGEYDCILKVSASSVEDLDAKLSLLKTHTGVVKTHTMLSLTTHKYEPAVLPSF